MPFLTEEVYQHPLPEHDGMPGLGLLASKSRRNTPFETEERQMEGLMEIIRAIRQPARRDECAGRQAYACDAIPDAGWRARLPSQSPYLQRLPAYASDVAIGGAMRWQAKKVVSAVCAAGDPHPAGRSGGFGILRVWKKNART